MALNAAIYTLPSDGLSTGNQEIDELEQFSLIRMVVDLDGLARIIRGEYEGCELRDSGDWYAAVQETSATPMPVRWMVPVGMVAHIEILESPAPPRPRRRRAARPRPMQAA